MRSCPCLRVRRVCMSNFSFRSVNTRCVLSGDFFPSLRRLNFDIVNTSGFNLSISLNVFSSVYAYFFFPVFCDDLPLDSVNHIDVDISTKWKIPNSQHYRSTPGTCSHTYILICYKPFIFNILLFNWIV